jgi:hypothetical protein
MLKTASIEFFTSGKLSVFWSIRMDRIPIETASKPLMTFNHTSNIFVVSCACGFEEVANGKMITHDEMTSIAKEQTSFAHQKPAASSTSFGGCMEPSLNALQKTSTADNTNGKMVLKRGKTVPTANSFVLCNIVIFLDSPPSKIIVCPFWVKIVCLTRSKRRRCVACLEPLASSPGGGKVMGGGKVGGEDCTTRRTDGGAPLICLLLVLRSFIFLLLSLPIFIACDSLGVFCDMIIIEWRQKKWGKRWEKRGENVVGSLGGGHLSLRPRDVLFDGIVILETRVCDGQARNRLK